MQDNKYVWKLEDIYADEQAWYQDLEMVKQLAKKLTAMQGRVCQDGHTLLETLDLTVKCNEYFVCLCTLPLRCRDGKRKLQKAV